MTPDARLLRGIAALFILSLCGCSWTHREPPSYPPAALDIISRFEQQNTIITAANGLASATITDKGETTRYRLAWACEKPDRLRIIVLFSGKPVATMLYDGVHLVIKSHTQSHELIKRRTKNPNLEKLIALPLLVNQLVDILSGSIPLPEHRSAHLAHNPNGGFTLTLLSRKTRPVIIFHLDESKQPASCAFTDKKNNSYHIRYNAAGSPGNPPMFLAEDITVKNGKSSLHLRIDQLHPNPGLAAETFKMISE